MAYQYSRLPGEGAGVRWFYSSRPVVLTRAISVR